MKMDRFFGCVCGVAGCVMGTYATDRTWLPSAGGSYEWTNTAYWSGGALPGAADQAQMRTTGQTGGDQTIHLANPASVQTFYPGSMDVSPYAQVFTGSSVSPLQFFRVMGGNAVFENTVNLSGNVGYIGYVYKAGVTLRKQGLLSLTNGASLYVGHRFSASYPGGPASLFIEDDAAVRLRGTSNAWAGAFTVGVLGISGYVAPPGRVWQTGGLLDAESYWILGHSADGYYRLGGGEVRLPTTAEGVVNGAGVHRLGSGAATYALLHVSGGTFNLPKVAQVGGEFHIGSQTIAAATPAYSEVYLSGGLFSAPDRPVALASWITTSAGTVAHQATLTVDGTAELYGRNVGVGNTLSPAVRATLNLNGGLLNLNYYLSRFGNAANQAALNFNGGTLYWRTQPGTGANSPLSGITNTTVFSRGGTLDTGAATIMTDTPFRTAKGYGVGAVTLLNGGSDYGAAPRVAISGGSGSNATAVAVMKRDGGVERVVVTCPGEGYLAGDTLTVSFVTTSAYGSGAQASATLSQNTPGTFRKAGSGTWQVKQPNPFDGVVKVMDGYLNLTDAGGFPALGKLQLTGGMFQSFSNQSDRVSPSAVLEIGGEGYAPVYRAVRPEDGLTNIQHFAGLAAAAGQSSLDSTGGNGVSEVHFGSYDREGALVGFTPLASNRVWFSANVLTDGSPLSPSTVSPVVAGFLTADGLNLLERDPASGYLQTATLSGTAGADNNFLVPAGVSTVSVAEANSVVFADVSSSAEFYFNTNGPAQVRSGMIVSRSRLAQVKRVGTLDGGSLTTEVAGGLVIYDRENADRRASGGYGGRYLISAALADPAADRPLAVTVAGGRFTPLSGALVRFMKANTFSGGLYLANGGVWFDGDSMLGVATGKVVAAGQCALRPSGSVLETGSQRPIEIRPNSALQLLGTAGDSQVASRIRGPISGSGYLLTGEYSGTGMKTIAEMTGDNSGFTGAYYVFGAVRAQEGAGLSTNANIRFTDNTSGFGTLDMSGAFTRPLGDGPGQVCWKAYASYGSLYGGFSAYGGPLTVNLHGDGRTLEWGSASLPSNAVVYLQNRLATHDLTFVNGMDLKGYSTPHIRVSTDVQKTATFKGVISDSVGGGTLNKGGQGILVLEQSPTFNGKLSIVSGKVRLAEGVSLNTLSEVSITGDGKALEVMGTQDVQTVSCKITGTGAVTVSDGGTTVLTGANTYSGATVVTNGSTLLVNGAHAGGGNYVVNGTLGGSGTIAPAAGCKIVFGAGSRLSPGGPGVIGTLTLGTPAATNSVELSGVTLDVDLAAQSADKVAVVGDLQIGAASVVNLLTTDAALLGSLRGTAITVCQWAGEKAGSFAKATNVRDWQVVEDLVAQTISVVYVSPGSLIKIQ
ncbi:MAG TPA: hypothetical protein PKM57_04480 [Kiritimatiellia bacterium]|nr:hypothetical protein [Kiritimatiellia bacterium]HPS06104.1 hypothetical protein [Kiritimatiellia bacterium]